MHNWDNIHYFLKVAQHGTVSKAAEALGVNHSTVTRRIRAFEESVGVRLFNKRVDGYELTEAAVEALGTASEMGQLSEQFFRRLAGQDGRLSGTINLTMPHDIYEYCLADDIADFRESFPNISLNLHLAKGVKNLANQEADIAVRLTDKPPDYLIGTRVCSLAYGIYRHRRLAAQQEHTQIIDWTSATELPPWAHEFPEPECKVRVDDLYSMYIAVRSGLGLARMPSYIVNANECLEIEKVNVVAPQSDWGIWVLNHVDLRKTERVRRCREHLLKAINRKSYLFTN